MQQRKTPPSKGWLTTKQAAEFLKVHESSIKRWCNLGELRHSPTPGGHRRIALADLLAFAKEQGLPLPLAAFAPFERDLWDAVALFAEDKNFSAINALAFSWLMGGHPHLVEPLYQYLDQEIGCSLPQLFDEVLRDLMRRVGEAWHSGLIGVGEEHLFTQILMDALYKLRLSRLASSPPRSFATSPPALSTTAASLEPSPLSTPHASLEPSISSKSGLAQTRHAIVGCAEGELHQLGSLCLRIVLEDLGWEVFYLGANVPIEAFSLLQRRYRAPLLCISFAPPHRKADAYRCIRVLSELYSPAIPYRLVLGGSALEKEEIVAQAPFLDLATFSRITPFLHWLRSSFSSSSSLR